MTREFHIYECGSCKHKEIYPLLIRELDSLGLNGTNPGT
jgi:hypothetical protein